MSRSKESELIGMHKSSYAIAYTLREMMKFAQAGMRTKELDECEHTIIVTAGKPIILSEAYEIRN